MHKANMVFGGGRSLGVKTLEWLCNYPEINIKAVMAVPREFDEQYYDSMQEIIKKYKLKVYSLDEICKMSFDFGLSVNYHKVLPEKILLRCKKGFFNVHHSYNLRLRGRYITTHAILNCRKDNIFYHGTTLHKMSTKLDAGNIVDSYSCTIENDDTAYTLFQKVDQMAFIMIKTWIPRIAFETVILYNPPQEKVYNFKAKDLPKREITSTMDSYQSYDMVRAFDFPGCEPAYIYINNKKIGLVLKPREEYTKCIHLNGNVFYTNKD